MKIKITDKSYEEVMAIPPYKAKMPEKQSALARLLLKTLSAKELKEVSFSYTSHGMEKLGKDEPCLVLMNHSSFIDLEIASTLLADRQYHIVCTDDGFVGKEGLMRFIGCMPTKKFIADISLVRAMKYCTDTLKSSILMYPEASYSFDGTETPLPESLGKCIKLLKVPVVMIKTHGAFIRDPLYNGLRKRKVKVSAEFKYLLSPDDVSARTADEINSVLAGEFRYDHFREQFELGVTVNEPFRAEGLERALYKCPHCKKEHTMKGTGTEIACGACGKRYTLREDGKLSAVSGYTEFEFVSDWYAWERECVREEIMNGTYSLKADVDIMMLVDMKSIYRVGEGTLTHDSAGFRLTGCDGKLDFSTHVNDSYSLYADYFWYETGDMICIGDNHARYYCFPKTYENTDVAKARLAAEEMYALGRKKKTV